VSASVTSSGAGTRSSVLFALGRLTAETASHRETLRELPERIVALLSPRLAALEDAHAGHNLRLARLEERQWLIIGGLTLVAVGTPVLLTFIKG
jgi:hypothetical protein